VQSTRSTASGLVVVLLSSGCVTHDTARMQRARANYQAKQLAGNRATDAAEQTSPPSGIPHSAFRIPHSVTRLAAVQDETSPMPEPGEEPTIERGPPGRLFTSIKHDFEAMWGDVWSDTKLVYKDPTNLAILLTAGGVSGALRPEVDDDIEDKFDESHAFSVGFRDALGIAGNPGTHFALAGLWYLIGTETGDTKTYEVSRTLFSGLVINGVSTMILKVAANTDSPNGEQLAWPSGHTSSVFTFAAIMHQSYGHVVGIPLYGLAGLAAFERLDDGEHHFSDVIFGGVMGLVVGHTVATGHRPQIFGGDIVPFADPVNGAGGIAWTKGF